MPTPSAKIYLLLLVALAGMYVGLLTLYTRPTAIASDQAAYFAMARYVAEDGVFYDRDFINLESSGNFFVLTEQNRIYPVYAPGYPLLLAAVIKIFGLGAEYHCTAVLAGLCLLMMYAVGRFFLPPLYAWLGAFLLATAPTFFYNAQIKNTHTFSVLLVLLAVWCLLAATRRFRGWKGAYLGVAACGLLLGYNTGVRYPDGLLLLIPLAYLLTARRLPHRWRLIVVGALAAAVPLGLLGYYHDTAFGSPFRTGYHYFNAQSGGFSPQYFRENIWVYLPGLVNYVFGPAFGVLLIATLTKFRDSRRAAPAFWLAWLVPVAALYHFYFWAASDPFSYPLVMRFYEVIFPPLIILGLIGLRRLLRDRRPRMLIAALAAFVAAQSLWFAKTAGVGAERQYSYYQRIERQVYFLSQHAPRGAVVFFPPAKDRGDKEIFYEELIGQNRWHLFSTNIFSLAKIQEDAKQELATGGADKKASTRQADKFTNLAATDSEQLFAELLATLRARPDTPLFYYGCEEDVLAIKEKLGEYFTFGETLTYDNFVVAWLMFPQGERDHNTVGEAKILIGPPLALVPLTLK
ncbi:hypothetical protein AGMMS49959_11490 [Planctomycetales bacterium]|nr:hypothetical protein AGMMS49959_11490 [Planctomycetales bacterium]